MVLIDTCGWIDWLTNGGLSEQYEPYFSQIDSMFVPTTVQFELYKWVTRHNGVQSALESIALTEQAIVLPLTTNIALSAADFAIEYRLSFADAIIFGTAQCHKAKLITSDDHFEGLPAVKIFKKREH